MKLLLPGILVFVCMQVNAQLIPPIIQWQKCLGGSFYDGTADSQPTADGGFIIAGSSVSNDGDLTGNLGFNDVWIVKSDAAGNIQWQKNLGGSSIDYANAIQVTTDGGYIVLATAASNNGDVSGNRGSYDVWVIKLDANGNIQWQKCYGGSGNEYGGSIFQTTNGGYIISASTESNNRDVTSNHGVADTWIIQIDASGNIQWQKCFGGSLEEGTGIVQQTPDGGYIVATYSRSIDGDVIGNSSSAGYWILKLTNTGAIQWQKFYGGGGSPSTLLQVYGGYTIGGDGGVTIGNHGGVDCTVMHIDLSGNILWQKCYGGRSDEILHNIRTTDDGGYIFISRSKSSDEDACNNYGQYDFWIVKLDNSGNLQWQKSYGGTSNEFGYSIFQTADGGYMAIGDAASNDNDVRGNNHGGFDAWVIKLSFPGIPIIAGVSITSDITAICPGQNITFTATPVNGGSFPSYHWKINGVDISSGSSTLTIGTLNNGDIVNCVMISNLNCITEPEGTSNAIRITVDPSLAPSGFLPLDTSICGYGTIELIPVKSYPGYLWSNNDTTSGILISKPGLYWLEVTDSNSCKGRDSIIVNPKDCIKGFYIPSAFTPNGDGKNDVFMPLLFGNVKQYRLTVYNRWGQIIFRSLDPSKGWDGTFLTKKMPANVYIWVCTYQFEGEMIKTEKGTLTIIR